MATEYKIEGRNQAILDKVDRALVEEGADAFANELMCSQCAYVHGARMLGFDEEQALLAASGFGWGMQHGERCGAVTGSLMALGMERELLGDIVVRENEAFLFCEERIAPYITQNFTQARHTFLNCEAVERLPEGALFETRRVTVQLASQRIDALIAHVYRLSRSEAQALFPAGKIFVSGRLCESPGYTPKTGDILSVRGFGRMKYVGIESKSKKGKENTAVDVYI